MGIKTLSLVRLLCVIILGSLAAACAGPMTPFGAVSLKRALTAPPKDDGDDDDTTGDDTEVAKAVVAPAPASANDDGVTYFLRPKITFMPKRQILHDKTPFSIVIDDPQGVAANYEMMILYNGIDVTKRFKWQAEESFSGRPANQVKLTMRSLRVLPGRTNKIEVVYWHTHNDRPAYARFEAPHCSAYKPMRIATVGDFEVPSRLLDSLTRDALLHKFNPTFVAGLIAQESAFNPNAMSTAKALGLTQITSLGEAEIIKGKESWPRYPNVNQLPSPVVRIKIMTGRMNARNEWRLNPELSIEGGVAYLQYLDDYWHRPDNYSLIKGDFKNTDDALTRLILASYNSGPTRVNYALQNYGRRWLRADPDLNEARRYVGRILSYCDVFARQEDESNASTP